MTMNKKKLTLALFVTTALLGGGLTRVATAGLNGEQTVSVWTDSGSGLLAANGTFKSTRASANNVEYIGCSRYAYDTGSNSITCYARNSAGSYASCFASDDKMLRVAETLNSAGYLFFAVNADGSCDRVITVLASFNL